MGERAGEREHEVVDLQKRSNGTPQTTLGLLNQAQQFALSQLVDGEAET